MKQVAITFAGSQAGPDEPKRRGNRTTRIPEILEVAIDVLARYGNVGFTLRRVASEVGIHMATLQHYFTAREDLLRAAMEEVAARYLMLYEGLVNDDDRTPQARLDAVVDVAFDELTKPGTHIAPFCLEGWSMGEREEFARELVTKFNRQFEKTFASLVVKINPLLSAHECSLRGRLLYTHLAGLIVLIRPVRGSAAADHEALRAATKVIWRALCTAPQ